MFRRRTSSNKSSLVLAFAVVALVIPFGGVEAGAAEPSDAGVMEVPSQTGTVSVVSSYDQPPTPSAPGATATEAEHNEGRVPPVPRVEDGVKGEGLGEPIALLPPGAQSAESPDDLIYAAEPVVATDNASSTAEPQIAADEERLLVTWNWGAAQSFDGGSTFRYLDPYTAFPTAGDGFCCDQLAAYIPGKDLWVWVLQYLPTPGPSGSNVLRLALSPGDEAFDALAFTWFDLSAQDAGFPDGVMLDQPKLGWTNDALFLSVNAYGFVSPDEEEYVGAIVWRLPMDDLVSGELTGAYFTTEERFDSWGGMLFGPYPIRESGATMYLAAHVDQATLGIWAWDDDSASPTYWTVASETSSGAPLVYPLGPIHSCPVEGAPDPVTSDWCAFADDRILGGWRRGDVIGYAWNVPQSPDWSADYPWVWATEIDTQRIDRCDDGGCVVGHPSIWLMDRATHYAALAGNEAGDVGGVVLAGGGSHKLECYAISRPPDASPEAGWDALWIAQSDADSPEPRSGDYLGVAPSGNDVAAWLATCMTLHASDPMGTETRVHVASFGRRADLEP